MSNDNTYTSCPDCNAMLTEDYERRYGRCMSCYLRDELTLEERMRRAL